MDRRSTLAASAALAALLAGGCDPQVDAATYAGESLFSVEGSIDPGLTASLPPVEAAILWQRGPPPSADDQTLAVRAPVQATGSAAGTFSIVVHLPPPEEAYRTLRSGEPRLARATIAAVPYGISETAVPGLPTAGSTSYGVSLGHWLVHLERDVPEGSLTAWWLGGALHAGFHLVRVEEAPCPSAGELAACVSTLTALGLPAGTATDVPSSATASAFCLARYRVKPATPGERVALQLGTAGPGPAGTCP
jgi:hypothetical protein